MHALSIFLMYRTWLPRICSSLRSCVVFQYPSCRITPCQLSPPTWGWQDTHLTRVTCVYDTQIYYLGFSDKLDS
jgi:hypothetical protein